MQLFLVYGYPVGPYDWGSRPDQGLPGYGHPGNRPPGSWGGPVDPGWGGGPPTHPGNWVPGSWGGRPDNSLPWAPVHPGNRPPGQGLPPLPGNALPPEFNRPDAGLPGSQPGIDNTLPGQPGYGTGQPIVPGATPYGSAVATAPPDKVDAEKGAWVLVNVQGMLVWAWAQVPKVAEKPPETPGAAPKK